MTTVRKLVCNFTTEDSTMSLSYNYIKDELSAETVKALMEGIITNGSIFAKTPVNIKSARIVTTTEDEIKL